MSESTAVSQLPDRSAGVLAREDIECGGARVELLVGGSGPPLVLLHGIDGGVNWDQFVRALANDFTVYAPSHPGFNASTRPAWINTLADLAAWYGWLLDDLPPPVAVVGHSIGGWLAAETAARGSRLEHLILIDPMGLEPPEGEIADVFLMTMTEFAERAFRDSDLGSRYCAVFEDDAAARWMLDRNMEMSSRVAWKPYMVDPALHGLLPRVQARVQIIWGEHDALVPVSSGERYRGLLPHAELATVADAAHYPHVEQPDTVVNIVKEFLQ